MEIEIGEYVRTKNGIIGKITKIALKGEGARYAGEYLTDTIYELDYKIRIKSKEIIKYSKNIIDLIEVGDIVNKHKVLNVCLDNNYKYVDIDCDKPSYESYLYEEQIETILTHEQYENNCYKVVE